MYEHCRLCFDKHFFFASIEKIYKSFDTLFESGESESGEEREGENRYTNNSNYGILPYILTYVKETNTSFNDTMKESVIQVFYVVSYILEQKQKEQAMIDAWRNKH